MCPYVLYLHDGEQGHLISVKDPKIETMLKVTLYRKSYLYMCVCVCVCVYNFENWEDGNWAEFVTTGQLL